MPSLTKTTDLRAELVEVTAERDALRAQLDGDLPAATRWLQCKVWRQTAALDALNRRVVSQRFVLRTLDELGRSLTAEHLSLLLSDAVGSGVLHVSVKAASCDEMPTGADPAEFFPACHVHQQDWGIPVRLVPGAATSLPLILRGTE